jgi:hypothetical protein
MLEGTTKEELIRLLILSVNTRMIIPKWQCNKCDEVFIGPYRPVCPECNSFGFWNNNITDEGLRKLDSLPLMKDINRIYELIGDYDTTSSSLRR